MHSLINGFEKNLVRKRTHKKLSSDIQTIINLMLLILNYV